MKLAFTRSEDNRREDIRDKLIEGKAALMEATEAGLKIIEDALSAINVARDTYNEDARAAYGFLEDIINDRESQFDEKSEGWQEGDRGEAARDWLDFLQGGLDELYDLDPITFDLTDLGATELPDQAETLDNLQTEADF
jgi:hypothetical protein